LGLSLSFSLERLERSGEPQSSLTADKKSNRRARDDFAEEAPDLARHLAANEAEETATR
jgi:hypothetical protein